METNTSSNHHWTEIVIAIILFLLFAVLNRNRPKDDDRIGDTVHISQAINLWKFQNLPPVTNSNCDDF